MKDDNVTCQNQEACWIATHVVVWQRLTEGEGDTETHTVVAQTVLDTTVEVFQGTEAECEVRLDEIYAVLSEEGESLRHLCDGLAKRDDKLASSMQRLIARTT